MTYTLTPTGLRVEGTLTYDDYAAAWQEAFARGDSATWGKADLLLYGEAHVPDYEQAIHLTKASYGGLRNLASLARAFPPQRRVYAVSPSHYMVVKPLVGHDDALVHQLLSKAAAGDMSRDDLAAAKAAVTRTCPVCRRVMLYRAGRWACTNATCEHDEPPDYAAPVRRTAEATVVSMDNEAVYVAVPLDAAAGLREGMTVKVSWVQGGAG